MYVAKNTGRNRTAVAGELVHRRQTVGEPRGASMPRITKVYTQTGDDGSTGLGGGQRVPKNGRRVEAYGTVDELNSALGLARAAGLDARLDAALAKIQNELFHLGSDPCIPRRGQEEVAGAPDRGEARQGPRRADGRLVRDAAVSGELHPPRRQRRRVKAARRQDGAPAGRTRRAAAVPRRSGGRPGDSVPEPLV